MLLKVKVGQAADVAHPFHKDSVVAHKVQDGLSTVGQGEIQHKGSQQYAGHLLHKLGSLWHQGQPRSHALLTGYMVTDA